MKAVCHGKFEVAIELLQACAKPNICVWGNKTAVHRVLERQSIALVEALVVHGAEVMGENVIEAAHLGNHHLMRVLLTKHKEVDLNKCFNGEVALCVSIW